MILMKIGSGTIPVVGVAAGTGVIAGGQRAGPGVIDSMQDQL
jgi:hypothetical protein